MKPNASLKSLKTNFLVMASRPDTSLQSLSDLSASSLAGPVNFWAIAAS